MNSVIGNYNVKRNYQQHAFKGHDPEIIKAIRDASVDVFCKKARRIPFEVAMFNIKLGIVKSLIAIDKGAKKVGNIFKK